MEIVYCDTCGFRIPNADFESGKAIRREGRATCCRCRVHPAPRPVAMQPSDDPGEDALPDKLEMPETVPVPGRRQNAAALPRWSKQRVRMLAAGVAVVVAAALVIGLRPRSQARSGDTAAAGVQPNTTPAAPGTSATKTAQPVPAPAAPAAPAAQSTPAIEPPVKAGPDGGRAVPPATAVVPAVQNPPVQSPVAAAAAPVVPEAPVVVPPRGQLKGQQLEDAAQEIFDKLRRFEDLTPDDWATRLRRMQEFVDQYSETKVASNAEMLMQEFRRRAADAPPLPVKPLTSVPDKTP